MNVKGLLELESPIPFHDIGIIHPITVAEIVGEVYGDDFEKMLIPYIVPDDLCGGMDLYNFLLQFQEYSDLLVKSMKVFFGIEDIKTLRDMILVYLQDGESYKDFLEEKFRGYDDAIEFFRDNNCIVIGENRCLSRDEFHEFVEIVRIMQDVKPQKTEEPKFKSEEGRERWLKMQEARKKFQEKRTDMNIENIINVVQFGKGAYIPSSEIAGWSMWKLKTAYDSIIHKDSYDKTFTAATSGAGLKDKDALKEHWTELLQVT